MKHQKGGEVMDEHQETPKEASEEQEALQKMSTLEEQEPLEALLQSEEKSYAAGEVPQVFSLDPDQFLPLNSEKLGEKAALNRSIEELEQITRDEISSIHKFQRAIDEWEKTIEKNKLFINRNKETIRKNNADMSYDEKNRDYWWRIAENVINDFSISTATNHPDTWAWLIKKHGLKVAGGDPIDERSDCVEEFCNGSANSLASKYKTAGDKYDQSKKARQKETFRIIAENAQYKKILETLQQYVQSTYQNKVEPLQDGVMMLKELTAKFRGFLSQPNATYGDLREWAETFLNEYILENPATPQHVITDFRKWASIPLPSENQ
ncbi:MAG: hypothetical protein AAGI90_03730 [Chlamydiota bacterium]